MEAHDTITFNSDGVLAPGSTTQDIKYQYTKAASGVSVGYLNYFIFSLRRALTFSGNQTTFLASQSLSNPVSTFQVASMPQNGRIWDVTDPFQTKVQSFTLEQSQAAFSVSTDTLRKFVSFTPDKLSAPGLESVVANQNLLGFSEPGLLIVTHPNFKSEAERLIKQGGVEINEHRVDDFRKDIDLSQPAEFLLRAGKKKFLRIIVE